MAGAAPAAAPAKAEAAPAAAAPAAATGVKDVNVYQDIGGRRVEVTEVMVKVGDKAAAEQSLITGRRQSLHGSACAVRGHREKKSKSC